jgi:Transglutaminase-like superfamily
MTEWSFSAVASAGCPPLARMLTAIAAEFGPVDAGGIYDWLDDGARRLFGLMERDGYEQVQRLAEVLDGELGLRAVDEGVPAELLLDRVLERRRGHPGVLSVIGCELALRAGVPGGVYSSPSRWFIGVRTGDTLTLLDAHRGFDWPDAPVRVRAHCAHEVAFCVLSGLRRRFAREGAAAEARRAGRLSLALPIDERLQQQVRAELSALD